MSDPIAVVRAWITALNSGDVDRMLALADDKIVFDTPRGLTHGHDELRDFMQRQTYGAALHVTPKRFFVNHEVVVVDALNDMRDVDSGTSLGAFDAPATFTVHRGRVTRFEAGEDLSAALRAAGIDECTPSESG